ncbi:MAG TPA: DUF2058 family protein, partial [Xanthomonadales bacterium]|nr:DUF2058 family protein [Xanthomonadales bacterium]
KQLAKGTLVIARHDQGYALLPRAAAELVRERAGVIVVDHAQTPAPSSTAAEDPYYDKFQVPDDLIW